MKVKDICTAQRGNVISEEDIYSFQKNPVIPIYSSQTQNGGVFAYVDQEFYDNSNKQGERNTITWTTDGNAGHFFYHNVPYLYTNVCGKLKLKNTVSANEVSMEYLALLLEQLAQKEVNAKGGNPKLMSNQVENMEIDLPPIEEQLAYVKQMNILKDYDGKLNCIIRKCDEVLNQIVRIDSCFKCEKLPIDTFFKVTTGSRITQTDVYEHQGDFPCVTSQTENDGIAWYADEKWLIECYGKKIINEKECLTWSKDGNAGEMFYRDYAFYPNDHCGVLILKPEYQNELNIKWFMYTYRNWIKSFASSDSSQPMLYNGTVKAITIPYPFPSTDFQNQAVEQYEKAQKVKDKCLQVKAEIKKIWDFD